MTAKTLFKWFIPAPDNKYQPFALRKKALTWYVIILFGLKASVGFLMFAFPQTAYYSAVSVQEIVRLTNQTRAEIGLPALSLDDRLVNSAAFKVNDMMQHQYFAHVSPQGVEPWYWFEKANYDYTYAGENLSIGFATNEGVHEAWMNSEGHRNNIINPNYRNIGVAITYGNFEGEYTTLIAVHFGSLEHTTPKPIPDYPLEKLKKQEPSEKPKEPAPSPAPTPAPEPQAEPEEDLPAEPEAPPESPQAAVQFAPLSPKFIDPVMNLMTNKNQLVLKGLAEANSIVTIYDGNQKLGQTKAGADSTFTLVSAATLADGTHYFRAQARDEAQNLSPLSRTLIVQIDTRPPEIDLDNSYISPNYLDPLGSFDVFAYVSENPQEVVALSGPYTAILQATGDNLYFGTVRQSEAGVSVNARDEAGNLATAKLGFNKPAPISQAQMVANAKPENSWASIITSLDKIIQNVVFTFIISILVMLLANIFINIRKQDAKMISSILLVMFLSTLALLL